MYHKEQGFKGEQRTYTYIHLFYSKKNLKLIVVLSVSSYDSSATHILKFTQDTTLGLEFGVGVGSTIKDVMH